MSSLFGSRRDPPTLGRSPLAFLLVLAGTLAFRAWCAARFDLAGDEAYFWEWSRHLAAGYYDHPGLVAYVIAASTALFGAGSELAVRLPALLAMAAVAVSTRSFALRIGPELGLSGEPGGRAALWTGLLALAVPVFAFFGVYASGDALLFLAWALALDLGWRAAHDGRWRSWIALGIAAGAGAQAKFLFLPFLPAYGLFLLASPRQRGWLARPHPYAAMAVALAINVPFLCWNAAHDWATFRFNLSMRYDSENAALALLELLGSQALVLSPGVCVLGVIASARILLRRSSASEAELYLTALFALPLAGFVGMSLLGKQIGAHWPAAAWLSVLVLLPARIERTRLAGAQRRARWMLLATLGLGACASVVGHFVLLVPEPWLASTLSHPTRPDQFNAGRLAELRGWREMGERVARERRVMQERSPERAVFLLAAQYGFAAQVSFYTPGQPGALLWERPRRHGQNYRYWDRFEELRGQDALFVTKRESRVAPSVAELREHFTLVHAAERIPIEVDGRTAWSIWVVRCEEFDGNAPSFP